MIRRPLPDIDQSDIFALVNDEVPEERRLEYKLALPGRSDADKKEFCADVAAMANSVGGDIIYGVREGQKQRQGIPEAAQGLPNVSPDQEERRLRQILESGTRPRVLASEFRWVDGFPDGPVLVLRVQPSWNGPHMVTLARSSPFYVRGGPRKHPMDVDEIRDAFLAGSGRWDRVEAWHVDRLAEIDARQAPAALIDEAAVILHILPFSTLVRTPNLAALEIKSLAHDHFQPVNAEYAGRQGRPNYYGWIVEQPSESGVSAYCQVFRDGAIESVGSGIASLGLAGYTIPILDFEFEVIKAVERHIAGIEKLGLLSPYVVLISLRRIRGAAMGPPRRNAPPWKEIDVDTLRLPHILIERTDSRHAIADALKPAFDVAWNASGVEESPYYDGDGKWKGGGR